MSAPDIVVIGAGFGGLAVGARAQARRHRRFAILEQQDDVGGVWLREHLPGRGLRRPLGDLLVLVRARSADWSRRFGSQPEIQAYLREVARDHGLDEHIEFGPAVTSATWVEETGRWMVTLASGGETRSRRRRVRQRAAQPPAHPRPPGPGHVRRPAVSLRQWDHTADLRGKRVAVVGGGASAIQVVPAVAESASR